MADKKPTAPAEKRKPTAADLKAAAAQLEEQETGVKKNTLILRIIALVLWALAAAFGLPPLFVIGVVLKAVSTNQGGLRSMIKGVATT